MDNFLLGSDNWKGVPTTQIRPELASYFKWIMETNANDRQLGWGRSDWEKISPRDMILFYVCMFKESNILSLACLF